MNTQTLFFDKIKDHVISQLDESLIGTYACDLHHELFNKDYFCIGYYNANKFIEEYGGAFKAIHRIKKYEEETFGQLSTDISDAEKVANMLAYIEGEIFLFESSSHLEKIWDDELTEEDIEILKQEFENF